MSSPPEPDPERHLKRLEKVFGVSGRIQQLATQRRKSPTKVTKNADDKVLLAKSLELRALRLAAIAPPQRFILDTVASHFNVNVETMVEGMCDDDAYIQLLNNFVARDGRKFIAFFYDEFQHPSIGEFEKKCIAVFDAVFKVQFSGSGRHVTAQKYTKMLRAICSDGTDTRQMGRCVVAYRISNEKELDMRNVQEDCNTMELLVEPGQSAVTACLLLSAAIMLPSCSAFKDYGQCRPEQKTNFLHGLKQFEQSLRSNLEIFFFFIFGSFLNTF